MSVLKTLVEDLERVRDELKLQIHLAGQEAKDEWESLEKKWSRFSADARLDETAESLGNAAQDLGEELKSGYRNLRDAIKK